ncbi:MAG: DUF1553 domain-containing protein [Bryobacterales bacterium]|nr:DUF1553 domain-containing protein [Bryobacterales bacterium]
MSTRFLFVIAASLCAAAEPSVEASAILARRCASCHNAKAKTAGVDLSTREAAMRAGFDRIQRRVQLGQMPPQGALPAAEQETLAKWIAAGAPWTQRKWWSLEPLQPAKKSMDAFIAEKLQAAGLALSPPASRRVLIRRASFGLTGLPPSPEEVEAFVNDARPNAYELLLDRLLASPRYGERWARHWLDVVRFTESEGFERDEPRDHAWHYRDYVIRALNRDKPYIDFAREQIAGDILNPNDRDAVIATGLLVFGPTDAVGLTSAVERERDAVREDQLEEMTGVVSQTFLGLTANCARCHDHKFDPIPQRDYYRLKAALAGVWQPFVDPASTELFPGGRVLDAAYDARVAAIRSELQAVEEKIARAHPQRLPFAGPKPLAQWTFDADAHDHLGSLHASIGLKTELAAGHLNAAALVTAPLSADIAEKTLEVWVTVRQPLKDLVSVFQIYNRSGYRGAASDGIQFAGGTNKQWRNLSTAGFRTQDVKGAKEEPAPGDTIHIAITYAKNGAIAIYRNGAPYGESYVPDAGVSGQLQTYFAGDAVLKFSPSPAMAINEARLYNTPLTASQIAASFAAGPAPALPAADAALLVQRTQLLQKIDTLPKPERAFAAVPRHPGITHLLLRGDVSRKAEALSPAGLSALPGADFKLAVNATDVERRRKLAEWIANPDNPLFSRVIVNRLWAHHFGAGIVENPNDFGVNGGPPSHPELLDTLARELMQSNWSLKSLHKKILLSTAYQQTSNYNKEAAATDAGNRLLWRFTPRRLEGEAIRDAMLAVSGMLNPAMGGPSFRPFKISRPGGSYVKYEPIDSDDKDIQRRTVYRMNVNTGGDPMLESLDCPVPAVKTPKRPSTTTALQALSLMNNALAVRLSKAFAARVQAEAHTRDEQVNRAFLLAFGRLPQPHETESSRSLSLQEICWGLFNASEFVYVE